ncbi:hypothetical protein HDV01_006874 [Terramyces sp. JEL0728]|nr:hypothetical protein HDV01_006874 [Terramyces sp. JEL0728]
MKLATISLASLAAGYSLCDKANYPYSGQSVTIRLVPTANAIQFNNQSVQTGVSGSITIVDGCDFQLSSDFTLNSVLTCTWFGGNINGPKDGLDGITLSNAPVTSASGGTAYQLISTPGNFVSFKDFTQFRLFHQPSQTLIATGDITVGTSTRVIGSAPNATSTSSGATTVTTGAKPAATTSSAVGMRSFLGLTFILFSLL